MRKKALILSADAGFGHRAAAVAVASALAQRHDDCDVAVVNPMEHPSTPSILRRTQDDYDNLVQKNPDLYRFGYRTSDASVPVGIVEQALIALLYNTMKDIVHQHRPDVIVTTYPLYPAPLAALFALRKVFVPLLTVVTDLASVHSLWFHDEVDLCLVPTQAVYDKALQHGLPAERVAITGLPVNPALAQPVDRAILRETLGWHPDLAAALFVGSNRVKRMAPVVQALNHSGLPLQLILVAGGSESLLMQFNSIEWHRPARVYGYVPDMARLMLASDFIICKAGGLIVSEALAAGLPILLTEAIPGQETGNADFVISGGAGELVQSGLEALITVCHWLDDDAALLKRRAANACRLGRPEAAYTVAELAWQAAQRGPLRREHRLLHHLSFLRELLDNV